MAQKSVSYLKRSWQGALALIGLAALIGATLIAVHIFGGHQIPNIPCGSTENAPYCQGGGP